MVAARPGIRVFYADTSLASHPHPGLSADEVERANRFRFDEDRQRFLACRVLLRRSLSTLLAVEPVDWRFKTNDFGRPEIAGPAAGNHLRFSASRTGDLVMCALTIGREIGADVERLRDHPADVVDHYFSSEEAAFVCKSGEAEKASAFFAIWTLKEAYCKAKGVGLSLPLPKISFSLNAAEPALTLLPPLEDDASDWHFRLLEPAPGYTAALCIDVRNQPKVEIETSWVSLSH